MSSKKVLLALPLKMLEDVDRLATEEHRTRSELLREAVRRYLANANQLTRSALIPVNTERNTYGGPTIG